jgi:hypothetical protein
MNKAERTTNNVEPFFHAISHYDSPDDVVSDTLVLGVRHVRRRVATGAS